MLVPGHWAPVPPRCGGSDDQCAERAPPELDGAGHIGLAHADPERVWTVTPGMHSHESPRPPSGWAKQWDNAEPVPTSEVLPLGR